MAVLALVRGTGIRGLFKGTAKKSDISRRGRTGRSIERTLEVLESRMMLTAAPTFGTVYNFSGTTTGTNPVILATDSSGNIYGETTQGAKTVFEIAAGTTTATVLHTFTGAATVGSTPSLVVDSSGNIFGTAANGGGGDAGTVFEIAAGTHTFSTVHAFTASGGSSTVLPTLTLGADGNIYGTTQTDGTNNDGTLYKLVPSTTNFTVLYNFTSSDGTPAQITIDSSGTIYGLTSTGGINNAGQIFKLPSGGGTLSTLTSFATGAIPQGITLNNGVIYGTTSHGGTSSEGSLFSLTVSNNTFTTLYSFTNATDGGLATGSPLVDSSGNIYGVTESGGTGNGTVFEYSGGTVSTLHSFANTDGSTPLGSLAMTSTGTIYGVTFAGGTGSGGTVYSLTPAAGVVASKLGFTTQPSASVTGNLGTITVAIEDANGSIVTSDNGSVTIAINTGGGKATGTLTVAAVNGVATFTNVSIAKAGTYTLKATSAGLTLATSNAFTLGAAPTVASKLVVKTQPTTTLAGQVVSTVTVYVEDKKGNLMTSDNSTVALAVSAKTGTLTSGTTNVIVSGGIATFSDLVFDTASTYTLSFSDGALKTVKSKAFKVTADTGSAAITITQSPNSTLVVGQKDTTALTFAIKDQFGNTVTGIKTKAVLGVESGPSGGVLKGTTSVSISSGKGTVKSYYPTAAGVYTLELTDAALPTATVTIPLTVSEGVSTLSAPKTAASYKLPTTVKLSTQLKSNAPSTIPYTGTATITDSVGTVVGTASVAANGKITIEVTTLAAGTNTLLLTYAGDPNHTDVATDPFTLITVSSVN